MSISKEKKLEIVSQYADLLSNSQGLIMTSFSGLSVRETEELRGRIREIGGEFHIIKNRLMRRALDEAGVAVPEGALDGTTAMGFTQEDIPGLAKAIVELSREAEGFRVKGGVLEGVIYDVAQVERVADLPPVPVLRAQLLATLQAPAAGVVGLIAASMRQIVGVMQARLETMEGDGDSPEAEEE